MRETIEDPDKRIKDALKLFMTNKLIDRGGEAYKPEISALTVHPFSRGRESGYLIGAVLYPGRLEVTPGYHPQHFNVQSIYVDSAGTSASTPFKRLEDVPFSELENALDSVWQAGSDQKGMMPVAKPGTPYMPGPKNHRHRTGSNRRAPDDRST